MATHYYVQLTDRGGSGVTADGGSLFEVSDVGFKLSQTTVSSAVVTSGGGKGTITFGVGDAGVGDMSLSVSSSGLSDYLSGAMASGTRLNNLDLFAVNETKGTLSTTPALHDGFTSVVVTGEHIDPETGLHTFTLSYAGVEESARGIDTTTGQNTGTTTTAATPNGHFTGNPTPAFSSAVTTTAAADQELDTYIRITDSSGRPLGGADGWIQVDSALLGATAPAVTVRQVGKGGELVTLVTPGQETLTPLQVTFAPGTLEPSLLATMVPGTSGNRTFGIELASYTHASGGHPSTLVDDVRLGNAIITASNRTSDAAVTYTIDYSQIASSHTALNTHGDPGTITHSSYNEGNHTTTTTLPSQAAPTTNIELHLSHSTGTGESSVACFGTGTLILTARGEVPVEALVVGEPVVTASGERRPIRWIGHRRTDCARHPQPEKVMPIRIEAGAVADGVPARDLVVSPGHALAVDGVLVKAERLVNGATVTRKEVAQITYWHIELDRHDLVVAEGMPAESYVDCANRHAFENGGPAIMLHPDFAAITAGEALGAHAAQTCLPLVDDGPILEAIRAALIERASTRFSTDPGVMLLADGLVVAPLLVEQNQYGFVVPAGTRSLRLISRSAVPCEVTTSESSDRRRLGVALRALTVDGVSVPCDGLGEGWHVQVPGRDRRWTDGNAVVPVGRVIAFQATSLDRYPLSNAATRIAQLESLTA